MPISFTCPHCGQSTTVADQYAGQTGPCASCGKPITIPGLTPGMLNTSSDGPAPQKRFPIWILAGCGCLAAMVPLLALVAGLTLPAINSAREKARRAVCMSNMRQSGLAMLNYESRSATSSFPPSASQASNGKESISWRTEMLPYLDQQALSGQYDKSQPWDGPKNQPLHNVRVELFTCPSNPPPPEFLSQVNQFVVNGPKCIFNGPQSLTARAIEQGDGLTATITIVESVRDPILWLEPRDVTFDDATKTWQTEQSAVSSFHPRGVNVMFADGHAEFLSTEIDPQVLAALLTATGGEVVDDNRQLVK
ncbi:MAG: DUF1559 domain-containing protein [Planctomycetaceae bacterium]|nr:DUF1559 domain-containing protein [Planctomycetaceae bacterium]